MRSECHEPLTSDCTDNTCCVNASDYYKNFFKGIIVKQNVSESILAPNISEGLFQCLLNFTQVKEDILFEQEDQNKLSKSCIDNDTLPIPYKLPELAEISYAYLFQVCEKGFEFAESLAPITGASDFTTIDVASKKKPDSDILSNIKFHIEENLPAELNLTETEYKIDAHLQNKSVECEKRMKSRLVPFDKKSRKMEGYEHYECKIGISYNVTIIQNLTVSSDITYINSTDYGTKISTFVNSFLQNESKIGEVLCCDIIVFIITEIKVPTSAIFISASAGVLLIAAFIVRQSNKPVAAESSRRIEIVFPVPSLPEVQEKIQKEEEILLPTGNAS